ncbi:MAG: tetratricopeptide repeat protein [Pyrinomonadaceae bacterium]
MENISSDSLFDHKRSYVFLFLACLAVYANSLSGDFVFDDTAQIVGNTHIHSWQNLIHAFTTDVWAFERGTDTATIPPPYYRPVFTIYLTVGYQLFGLWQQGWHLLNLAIHTGATILTYRLFLNLSDGKTRLSFIAALLFALLPVHVESISWISGIPDPLAALFYIPSFIFYIHWRKKNDKKFLIYSVVFFFLSLLCKETPIVLPLILFIWELTLNRPKETSVKIFNTLKRVVIFIVPIAVYFVMRIAVLGKVSWKHPFIMQTPTEFIYATIPYVVVLYLKHIIFPFNLSLIYATRFVEGFGDAIFWIPLLILLGLVGLTYFFRSKFTPLMWMAAFLFIVPLLPVLNLQVFHYEYIVQDRYLYLPSIGFVLFVGCLLEKLRTSEKKTYRQIAMAATVILCLAYAAGTFLHNRVWHSEIGLWTRGVEVKPDSWGTHYNLGLAYYQNKEYQLAADELNKSLSTSPDYRIDDKIYNNRGLAFQELGKTQEAKRDFIKAVELNPKSIEAIVNLGALYFNEGSYTSAETEFKKAVELKPANTAANYNFAKTSARLGRHKEAIIIYEKLLPVEKQDADLMYNAAVSYAAIGQKDTARTLLDNAYHFAGDETLKKQIADEIQKLK